MEVWISKCLLMLQREFYHIDAWFINAVINLLFYLFTYHSFTSLWTLMLQGMGSGHLLIFTVPRTEAWQQDSKMFFSELTIIFLWRSKSKRWLNLLRWN